MKHGETRRYGVSGALLASNANVCVVPVAHDAGHYWPRRGIMKKSGTIRVVIGKPVAAAGRDVRELNAQVQEWIETTIRGLS
jgi:1-acyl-sn-glycerol-3-phosphate acyltransferase